MSCPAQSGVSPGWSPGLNMTTSTPYLPSSILIPADIDRRAAFEAVYIVRVGKGQSVQKLKSSGIFRPCLEGDLHSILTLSC